VLTRKQLLGAGAAAGSAALVSACGGGSSGGPRRSSHSQAQALDLKLVGSALDLEHTLVAAYAAGADLLRGSARRAAREIVEQEQEHAKRLSSLVRDLGGQPNPPKTKEEYLRSFPRLTERADALRFGVDLENSAVRYYLEALPHLSTPELRRLAASIATSEAGHAALLRGELGRVQVPDAFATGRSQAG
jgi:rubrerythrin